MTHPSTGPSTGASTDTSASTANDCDPVSASSKPLSVEQASAQLLAAARVIDGREQLPPTECLGRVLAEPVISGTDLPGWDNSAMDGYALRAADLRANSGWLPVTQRIAAGHCGTPLTPGTAARIFTGAPLPEGADTVVVQEACAPEHGGVRINAEITAGANIRRRGEELQAGAQVLKPGIRLGPQHLGLAAGVGAGELWVYRRLRVAVLASGDELVMPGEPLGPGQIYNSNRFLFRALLQALGCEVIDLGIIEDDREATLAALGTAAEQADLVLASGGVSVGDEDHVRPAVEQLGSLDLWRVAMKPGKPLAFGRIGETPFIGSPGNPVSLFVTFCLFARPFIERMQGVRDAGPPTPLWLPAGFELTKPLKRRDYQRARLEIDATDKPAIQVFSSTSSAALSSLTWANGLALIPSGQTIAIGDPVAFLPFSELVPGCST
ncbi:gephyrin-like molybdotransferase Glp [Halochromatium salexigens]|uniref:Molybdopterin molybdenumtransferase n=1 Tax=Halochromatium salexigens TaxID=49447 RepID=A0AAJ0XEV0_HALSE|nr:gephyrin-like molybdotransferase Glp [Halochromatium salexigens]MBK5929130.1 molybdopterin molybdenumtransferase MoeA [Halochromatium salexigens]